MSEPQAVTRVHDQIAVVLLILCAVFLRLYADDIGPTVDEPYHLIRGLAWWWTDSTHLSYAHPPLANLLQAAPGAWMHEPVDLTTFPGWESGDHSRVVTHLVRTDYPLFRSIMMAGRVVSTALTLLLAAITFVWTSRRVGGVAGLAALSLLAFNPTVLAHGQITTTDLPVALASLGVALTFADYLKPPGDEPWRRWSTLAWFTAAMSAALCTKFTALALVPVLGLLGLVWASAGWGRFRDAGGLLRRVLTVLGDMTVVGLVAVVAVGAIYRFQDWGLTLDQMEALPEPQCSLTKKFSEDFLEQRELVSQLPHDLPIPLPYSWFFGMEMVRFHGEEGHRTWFLGSSTKTGHWAYFPLLLLLKTPPVLWLGLLWSMAVPIRHRRWPRPHAVVLVTLIAFFLYILGRSNLNIGMRHALPVVPMLSILAGIGFGDLVTRPIGRIPFTTRAGVLAALLATAMVSTAWNAGHYLSWFNVGELGYEVSVVGEDWGQDTPELARLIEAEKPPYVAYVSNGLASAPELAFRGVKVRTTSCKKAFRRGGWAVQHRANVVRARRCTAPVDHRPPDRVLHGNILIWELGDADSGGADTEAEDLDALDVDDPEQ